MRSVFAVALAVAFAVVAVKADHNCDAQWNFCANGGECHDVQNSAAFADPVCACPAPYTGAQCERHFRECVTDTPCRNGATCATDTVCSSTSQEAGDCYQCFCRPGFAGMQCREPNACWSQPCRNGATCSSNANTPSIYRCSCVTNSTGTWAGVQCDTWYPKFDCNQQSMLCQNGGTCQSLGGGVAFVCLCTPDKAGGVCEQSNFCNSGPCANGGTCLAPTQTCQCPANWAGLTCTTPTFCSSNPCQNGGTCNDIGNSGGGSCDCSGSYYGDFCEKSWVQEGCGLTQCSHGGTCSCSTPNAAICLGNNWATTCDCSPVYGDCQCNSTVVDYCPTQTNACWNGGTCINFQDGYRCLCRDGFYGDKCENYDNLCVSANKCQNGGRCTMTRKWSSTLYQNQRGADYQQCDCQYPYYGEWCENVADVDALCWSYSPCPNNGNCTLRAYDRGYWSSSQGVNNGQRQQLTPHVCNCPAGLYGDDCSSTTPVLPPTCATLVAANPNYCLNGGTCNDIGNGPQCWCRCGYSGDSCEVTATDATRFAGKMLDFCSTGDLCYNGGTCHNDKQGQKFVCNCQPGFWGTRCQNAGKSAGVAALPSLVVSVLAVLSAVVLKKAF